MGNNSFQPHVWYGNSGDVVRSNIMFGPYRPIRAGKTWRKGGLKFVACVREVDSGARKTVAETGMRWQTSPLRRWPLLYSATNANLCFPRVASHEIVATKIKIYCGTRFP